MAKAQVGYAAMLEQFAPIELLELCEVAEGIEDETQLHNLRQLGADYGQGFLFGEALSPEQVEELLRSPGGVGREVA